MPFPPLPKVEDIGIASRICILSTTVTIQAGSKDDKICINNSSIVDIYKKVFEKLKNANLTKPRKVYSGMTKLKTPGYIIKKLASIQTNRQYEKSRT